MKKLAFAVLPLFLYLQNLNTAYGDEKIATQGQFAIKLAEKLGHQKKGLTEEKAIRLLSQLSIFPGIGPDVSWKNKEPATTKFVADIQASMQVALKGVARSLNISPPPTLDLFVFELPPAAQRVTFPSEKSTASSPDGCNAKTMPPLLPPPNPNNFTASGTPAAIVKSNLTPESNTVFKSTDVKPDKVLGAADKSNDSPIIDNEVISAFANETEVPVIIELRQPKKTSQDVNPSEAEVANAQKAVLDTLGANEFRLKHQYQYVYSFSGWITKEGLMRLQHDPNVLQIHIDGLGEHAKPGEAAKQPF